MVPRRLVGHPAGVFGAGSAEGAGEFAALAELAEAFMVLVRALVGDGGSVDGLGPGRILELAAHCVPHGQHAALMVRRDGRVEMVAATSGLPDAVDRIRGETGQGPALDVLETNDLVVSNELAEDPRWPVFGEQVVEATGIRSILSYRLYLGRGHRAALTFYSDWPHAFDNLAIATGAIFAAYCSLVMFSELVLDEPLARRRAEEVHREIGVAVGILMATGDLSTEAAYRRLHQASRRLRRSVPDVARAVIAGRHLPDPPDAGPQPAS
jgi:hypothetical protein